MVGTGILPNNMRSPLPNVTRHSGWWPYTVTPSIDGTLHQFLILILTLLPILTFYQIMRGFHRTFATGAACQQRTLTAPDTWSCPTLGLAFVLMSRPISPELVLFPDFWVSSIPRCFSFALDKMWNGAPVHIQAKWGYEFTEVWLSCFASWKMYLSKFCKAFQQNVLHQIKFILWFFGLKTRKDDIYLQKENVFIKKIPGKKYVLLPFKILVTV